MMRPKFNVACIWIATAVVVSGWADSGLLRSVAAKDFKVVPLKVNVLKGVTIPADEINEVVKAANQILKQADVRLEFDKDKNIDRDVDDQGNHDDKIDRNEFVGIWKKSVEELARKFGQGKGYKVMYGNQIGEDPKTGGESTVTSTKPVTFLKATDPRLTQISGKANDL